MVDRQMLKSALTNKAGEVCYALVYSAKYAALPVKKISCVGGQE